MSPTYSGQQSRFWRGLLFTHSTAQTAFVRGVTPHSCILTSVSVTRNEQTYIYLHGLFKRTCNTLHLYPSESQRNLRNSRRWNKNANGDRSTRSTLTQSCNMLVTLENTIALSSPRWSNSTEQWWAITQSQTERRKRRKRGLRRREWEGLWYAGVFFNLTCAGMLAKSLLLQGGSLRFGINVCFWETAHLPLPKPNILRKASSKY